MSWLDIFGSGHPGTHGVTENYPAIAFARTWQAQSFFACDNPKLDMVCEFRYKGGGDSKCRLAT